jgi:hypothetical protein
LVGSNNARLIYRKKQYGCFNNTLKGLYINNSTYAYKSMLYGDMFAKKFGGPTGNDPDFFLLTIKGYTNGLPLTDSVNFYLADYRFADNSLDYIVKDWTYVDLSVLSEADELEFNLTSSDIGVFGMNTPAFYCLDQLVFEDYNDTTTTISTFDDVLSVPDSVINKFSNNHFFSNNIEFDNNYDTSWNYMASGFAVSTKTDSITPGYTNMYSAANGTGLNSAAYGVVYGQAVMKANTPMVGFYVNNNTYAYYSMLNGDAFAKKFGGTTGNDPDYFKLIITRKGDVNHPDKSIEFYLADYRFANNRLDYIIRDWTWVDLTPLAYNDELTSCTTYPSEIQLTFAGSDTGMFGLNTPMYVCVDNVVLMQKKLAINNSNVLENQITLYPNPAVDFINLDINNTNFNYQIIDIKGSLVKQGDYSNTVYVGDLTPGVYMIKLNGKFGKIHTQRFIKQ